jgi:hypothetical protein
LADVFTHLAFNEHTRAQELPVSQFVKLAQALQNLRSLEENATSHDMRLLDSEGLL